MPKIKDSSKLEDEVDSELVGAAQDAKNWKGIFLALMCIAIIILLVIIAIVIVTPDDVPLKFGIPFRLDNFLNEDLKPRKFDGRWVKDRDVFVYRSREGEIWEHDVERNFSRIIMDNSTFRQLNTDIYFVSEDRRYVLIAYDVQTVFRHSYDARYVIYNRDYTDPKDKLLTFPQSGNPREWQGVRLQQASWGPYRSELSFVHNNQLYYQSDPFTTATAVTRDGSKYVYNGMSDWLYEEELLHQSKANWFSPKATRIAYIQFNDTEVPKYKFPKYGPGTSIYGQISELSYPKAGDSHPHPNPIAKLYVVNTNNAHGTRHHLKPPHRMRSRDHYITSVTWRSETHLLVAWSNRPQNETSLTMCDVTIAECHEIHVITAKGHRGWVAPPKPFFIENGQKIALILPERDSNRDWWNHVAILSVRADGQQRSVKTYLTQGLYEVKEIVGYDEREGQLYFVSALPTPEQRHVYRITVDSSFGNYRRPTCLSCQQSEDCKYHTALFSASGKHFILKCLGPGAPRYFLNSTDLPGGGGSSDTTLARYKSFNYQSEPQLRRASGRPLEENKELQVKLAFMAAPIVFNEYVKLRDGYMASVRLLLPPTLNMEHITRYPTLVEVYGGPGSQKVTDEFKLGWETYLTSSENVIHVTMDVRGSSGHGLNFMHQVYRRLGTVEIEDHIQVVRELQKKYAFIDRDRTAMWGWSYGGFVTTHALAHPADVIKCGVAVAPVTDWRYYDTAYTERYMGLASSSDNYAGYDMANVVKLAANLKGKQFMLIHGTADDNVHFQHTAQLSKALVQADVDFRLQVYSDKAHSLRGPKTSRHLYKAMTNFLISKCWHGGEPKGKPKKTKFRRG